MNKCVTYKIDHTDPEALVLSCKGSLRGNDAQLVIVSYPFCEYWLDSKPCYELTAIYLITADKEEIRFTVLRSEVADLSAVDQSDTEVAALFQLLCTSLNAEIFSTVDLLPLQPVFIPKPWGQEIWYTGIEARGVAGVGSKESEIKLPQLLSALPVSLCNGLHEQLILLKVLDPLPDDVFGDLYFELHQQKREVYVVTAIDEAAWPTGKGAIRFGLDQDKRKACEDDKQFRNEFVTSVKAYESVRREIDGVLDNAKNGQGIGVDQPVSPEQLKTWLALIPAELKERELQLRMVMNGFTALRTLQVGDVVKVPCLTPHSLQHGVRTIEFQTPVYERLIVSFAQKVLTQSTWDTEQAAALMALDAPEEESFEAIAVGEGVTMEKIVDFKDFEVYRCQLLPGKQLRLAAKNSYSLLVSIRGDLNGLFSGLVEGQAALIPQQCELDIGGNDSNQTMTFLLARPK